jgi:hypothetical protein
MGHPAVRNGSKGVPPANSKPFKARATRPPGSSKRIKGCATRLPQFWQPRFYDFNVWSQKKFVEKLQYLHLNPWKRKLVAHPQDWPWSSFSFYAKRDSGLIRVDPSLDRN